MQNIFHTPDSSPQSLTALMLKLLAIKRLETGVVLFQRTVVLLSFYVLSLLIVKVSHRVGPVRDAI